MEGVLCERHIRNWYIISTHKLTVVIGNDTVLPLTVRHEIIKHMELYMRRNSTVIKSMGSEARLPGFESQALALTVYPESDYLTSLGLSAFIHKMG